MSQFGALKDKSIFVTGHTGFKGSWLSLWLSQLGANVSGFSLEPPSIPNNFTVSKIEGCLQHHFHGDIRNEDLLFNALQSAAPDIILHLAAQTVVREGYCSPRETFDVNVMGTISLLECVRRLDRPCIVICVTSDKCYHNKEQVWGYKENDAMGERDPYGGSKGAAELAIRSYRHSYFPPERIAEHSVKLASARAGNVIGGGDWKKDALIVDMVKALSAGEQVALRNPTAVRPWQHVFQCLDGYLTLSCRMLESDDPKYASGWNFGPAPGDNIAVSEIAEIFLQEWGSGSWIDASNASNPKEAGILRVSIEKAIFELGWKPGWDVRETVRRTVEWYRNYVDGAENMQQLCFEQIAAYEAEFDK